MIEFLGDLAAWFASSWDGDTGYLMRIWEHVTVSGAALLAAVAVALPLGAWFGHTGRGGMLVTSMVNVGRALPSFGIVALALPITIRLADALPVIDSGLGFLPTFVALFALAAPPVFINTHAGIRGVDPDTVEAARGMGIDGRRVLTTIELPMAAAVIMYGIRVTAVQIVATAPLGALVAYGGLGRFIIDGFAVRDSVQIAAGAILVALLAVATDIGFSRLERRVVPKGITPTRKGGNIAGDVMVDPARAQWSRAVKPIHREE
ncbi:MAG: ABC transporter permease [Acidimicrobiia bacterium]|nr:ABC transporter permease [Acidimicrobiia bacterium]